MAPIGLPDPAHRGPHRQEAERERDGDLEHQEEVGHLAENSLNADISTTLGEQMKWITRKNASVDRIACPWLIKRFIDPEPEFMYVPAADVISIGEREGAIPYDVGGVELGHVDGRCSFESIILKYELHDPALDRLAQIVHGADVSADIDQTPEAAGLKAIAHGFAMVHGENDHLKIALETPLYDALYAWCQHEAGKVKTPMA